MNISDLSYLGNVSDNVNILGGRRRRRNWGGSAKATADASAVALGRYSRSDTYTNAEAVSGVGSSSYSGSFAYARH